MTKPLKIDSPLRATVRAMARRKVGVATDEIDGATIRQVGRVLEHLIKDGEVYRGKAARRVVRYYGHQADAEAFTAAYKLAEHERKSDQFRRFGEAGAARMRCAKPLTARAPWDDSAEPYFPVKSNGEPAWKFTACPPPRLNPFRTDTHGDDLH